MSASSWSLDLSSEIGVLCGSDRVYFSSLVVLTVKLIGGASSVVVGSSVVVEAMRVMVNVWLWLQSGIYRYYFTRSHGCVVLKASDLKR